VNVDKKLSTYGGHEFTLASSLLQDRNGLHVEFGGVQLTSLEISQPGGLLNYFHVPEFSEVGRLTPVVSHCFKTSGAASLMLHAAPGAGVHRLSGAGSLGPYVIIVGITEYTFAHLGIGSQGQLPGKSVACRVATDTTKHENALMLIGDGRS
jgi:hypothetical protein